jgi:hypothetical protein
MDPTVALITVSVAVVIVITLFAGSTGYSYHLGRKHGQIEIELAYTTAARKELLQREQRLREARGEISEGEAALGDLPDIDVDGLLSFGKEEAVHKASASKDSAANKG